MIIDEQKILDFAKRLAYSSEETLMFSYNMALKMRNKSGDYVECGVAAGAQIIAMALAAPNKNIHAFDSFEGIPLPSNKDDQMPGIRNLDENEISSLPSPGSQKLESSGATIVNLVDFIDNIFCLPNPAKIMVHKGWFENTVPKNEIKEISILRLDGDLYNSTYICLKHLFPKVIKGGVIIIDDWQLKGCRDACTEYFNEIKYTPDYQTISNIVYFIK